MNISDVSFPPGGTFDGRLQNAMFHWNDVRGAYIEFRVLRDRDNRFFTGNLINEILFLSGSSSIFPFDDVLAVTSVRTFLCSIIIEKDIVFNATISWTSAPFDPDPLSSLSNFEAVALHELGHVLGLKHEDRRLATMNSLYPSGGPFGHLGDNMWRPWADDRQGVRFLYPDSTTGTDIAASAMKLLSLSNGTAIAEPVEYCQGAHNSCPPLGNILSVLTGSEVTMEFTHSNLGTTTVGFNIGFYLSTNDFISTSDLLVATHNPRDNGVQYPPGHTRTAAKSFQIPLDLSPGTYYLGFIVDYDHRVTERDENNNAAALAIPIRINADVSGSPPNIEAEVFPHGRAVQVGVLATTFATITNLGGSTALSCSITPVSAVPGAGFLYAPVNAVTGALSGPANTPVNILAGASQKFNITFVPTAPLAPVEVSFIFDCANTTSAPIIIGFNTLLLSASLTPVPDLVALTSAPGGILTIPSGTASGVFLIASLNLGAAGLITMSADTGATALPVGLLVCEFNAALGTCFQPPSVTTPPRTITSGEVTFYAVFVISQGTAIPLNPFTNRVFARFLDAGNVPRGLTNVLLEVIP